MSEKNNKVLEDNKFNEVFKSHQDMLYVSSNEGSEVDIDGHVKKKD